MGWIPSLAPVDDRGVPLKAEGFSRAIAECEAPSAFSREAVQWGIGVVGVGIAAYLLVKNVGSPRPITPWWAGLVFALAYVCVLYGIALIRRRRGGTRVLLPHLTAWLAAHRRCGACGEDMRAREPESDGCATCSRCGAAWHEDRWTRSLHDPKGPPLLVARLCFGGNLFTTGVVSDDRRVPLDRPLKFPPSWLSPRVLTNAELRQIEADFRELRYTHSTTVRMRAACLRNNTCPGCGEHLARSEGSTFDGCSACARCGRAWYTAEIGREPRVEFGGQALAR